jgi:hypothetical protein
MATIKQTFLASDGKEFKTEHEADAHDLYKSIAHKIDDFTTASNLKPAQATLARTYITGYLAHSKLNFKSEGAAEVTALPEIEEPA